MSVCAKCWGTGQPVDHVKLGREARAIRLSSGVSLTERAGQLGISAAQLSLLEQGKRSWKQELYWKATHGRLCQPTNEQG